MALWICTSGVSIALGTKNKGRAAFAARPLRLSLDSSGQGRFARQSMAFFGSYPTRAWALSWALALAPAWLPASRLSRFPDRCG
jgi:hypothetical protein